ARVLRGLVKRRLSDGELDCYRQVAPTADFRRGWAELPRQLFAPWLARLEADCREVLRDKPALLLIGEKSRFLERPYIRRFQAMFPRNRVVELPRAGHFFQEDAPAEVAAAIRTSGDEWWPTRSSRTT